jgi:hypothetical protein
MGQVLAALRVLVPAVALGVAVAILIGLGVGDAIGRLESRGGAR